MNLQHRKNEKSLWIALSLTSSFIVVEIIGGLMSHSLALLSDAAHLFTDAAALIISITAMRLGRKDADKKRTYGYYRLEIIAAVINAVILFLVAIFIFYEAYRRLFTPHEIHTMSMLIIASIGFFINLISVNLLRSGSKQSLNVKSAYLDAQADMISSIGVVFTAFLIFLTHWQYFDSIVAIGIALWILPRTWILLKESINILLEGVPEGIDVKAIQKKLENLEGVQNVHDVHVWALTNKQVSLTAHLVIQHTHDYNKVLKDARKMLMHEFSITHTTLQPEDKPCGHSHS